MTAYYNENDPHAAQWLRNLIEAGEIAPGYVDERSILDVAPSDLWGFTQCHFFAGVGVWSRALRDAGWLDERPVWTGSCPCQPFSSAGKGGGFADERHLWPAYHWLLNNCRPECVLGEQVASKDGLAWLDLVYADLESSGYACGAVDLCAAGVGAPHIRQRLWFVAYPVRAGRPEGWSVARYGSVASSGQSECVADADGGNASAERQQRSGEQRQFAQDGRALQLANSEGERLQRRPDHDDAGRRECASGQGGAPVELADATSERGGLSEWPERREDSETGRRPSEAGDGSGRSHGATDGPSAFGAESSRPIAPPGIVGGFWRGAELIYCTDEKFRPIEPGTFPLVDGSAFRVGSGGAFEGRSRAKMLKGYGNAIVREVAVELIKAAMAIIP